MEKPEMNERAFKLGYAFAMGMKQAKRGMAMDGWVTLQNKEGENYHVDLPGENPNSGNESKKTHKSLADKIRNANGGTFEHEGKTYQAQSDPEKQAKSIIERQEQIKNRPKIPEKQRYLKFPVKVSRETEKAVAIPNPIYESAKEQINESKFRSARQSAWMNLSYKEREAWENKETLLWLPKSRTTIKDGVVYGTEPWIAKNGWLAMDSAINSMLEM